MEAGSGALGLGSAELLDSSLLLTGRVILDKSLYQSGKQKPLLAFQQRLFD